MSRKKKSVLSSSLSLLFLCFAAVPGFTQDVDFSKLFHKILRTRVSFQFTGGTGRASIGDLNRYLGAAATPYYSRTDLSDVSGSIDKMSNWEPEGRFELKIEPFHRFAVGFVIAGSPFDKKAGGMITAIQGTNTDRDYIYKSQMSVKMKFGLNFYYSFFSRGRFNVYAKAGYGKYSADVTVNELQQATNNISGDSHYISSRLEVNRTPSYAGLAGLGLEYSPVRGISLIAEFEARSLKFKDLNAKQVQDNTITESWLYPYNTHGNMLIYGSPETGYYLSTEHPWHITDIPYPAGYIEREATLNMSGYSFRVGFSIRVF